LPIVQSNTISSNPVLTAEPSRIHRRFFSWYFRRRARKAFARILVSGLDHLRPWSMQQAATDVPTTPLVLVANHTSWWDAVMPILISLDALDHDAYGFMEGRQLDRYGFFRRLGMFSIDRENPRAAIRSLQYGADLVNGTSRVLWIFPQGEIVPNDRRPIICYSGTSHLIRMLGQCTLAPIAFRYELLDDERPVGFARIGEVTSVNTAEGFSIASMTERITELLTGEVDQLRDDVIGRNTQDYEPLIDGTRSINEWWDSVRGM
jgi:hypothetical protein